MDREVWVRGGMVLSIFALVVLILVTPFLLGRPPSELASYPLLIIGMAHNESAFIVNVGAAINAYQYDYIRIRINESDPSVNGTFNETDSYGFHRWVPGNVTFSVNVYLIDRQGNYFEYNVTVRAIKVPDNRTVIVITFPYEKVDPGTEVRQYPPNDFRRVIPWRGRDLP
ncbi:MAG: hypothetical protein ACREDF_08435 [Thermoplasmata archaeon]